jgi:hypothetical protein
MPAHYPKVAARTADEIVRHFELGEPAQALFRPGMAPGQLLEALLQKELWADAARFLAHGLPRREAVWWACLAARGSLTPATKPAAVNALRAAEAWAVQPTEDNRWAAQSAAEAAQLDGPAALAAMGAFLAGPTLIRPAPAPPGAPPPQPVPPDPFLTAKLASGAILLAASAGDPAQTQARWRRLFAQGIDVANGGTGTK